jgi:hypothetical protein
MTFTFSPKLDQTFLHSLYEDDLLYAQEIFNGFLVEAKTEFEGIKNDYSQNALKSMRQKLHKIKPTFSFVGLPRLTEKTEALIVVCDNSSDVTETEPGCSALFTEIEDSFLLVEKELLRMKEHLA